MLIIIPNIPKMFQKRETARNAWKRAGNVSRKVEMFHVDGKREVLSRKHLRNISGPFKRVSGLVLK